MIKILFSIIAVLLSLYGAAEAKNAHSKSTKSFSALVTHITDGDTIWVKRASDPDGMNVRIFGIDAPEICQDYGRESTSALLNHLQNKTVTIASRARDKYGRTVALVNLNGKDVSAWMVENGYAWSYHSGRNSGPYAAQEASARQARRGLWASRSPTEPKVFRKKTNCH